MIDKTMKEHTDYKLYNLIKQQVPKRSERNASVTHHRLNVTLPIDQNSSISIPDKKKEKQLQRVSSVARKKKSDYSGGKRWRNKIDLAVSNDTGEKRYDKNLKDTFGDL